MFRLTRPLRHSGIPVLAVTSLVPCVPFADPPVDLAAFPVFAGSLSPSLAGTGYQLTDRMEREVRVDLQTRGGTRYQSDITIRGGIFEGSGLMIGGMTLFDPQTGHYFSEIPLDPRFFSGARLLTGSENTLNGFNATAGSIDWIWGPLETGGSASVTIGTDGLYGMTAHAAARQGPRTGWELAVLKERGDGSLENGDFDVRRISGRVEIAAGAGLLRLFGGYVDKFYGWPGMYTGNAGLNETDDYQVSLLGFQWESGEAFGRHRIGGYWRKLDDDYEFRRETPNAFYEHQTEVWSLQGSGNWTRDMLGIGYNWAVMRDRIIRSTSLVNGRFNGRAYGEAAVRGQWRVPTRLGELAAYGGAGLETTDRDATVLSPFGGFRLGGSLRDGSWETYLEFSESSQVPGYTVLNSASSGLFGGNPDLGREQAESLEAGAFVQRGQLAVRLAAFRRDDGDLVDWVYNVESPNAREAAAVDLRVTGIEAFLHWEHGGTVAELGYTYLDKVPEYREAGAEASFYALNFACHRMVGSLGRNPASGPRWRIEAEYRDQAPNDLRGGADSAFFLNLEAAWRAGPGDAWTLVLRVENLTGTSFERIPGTPGPGREARVTLRYGW